MKDLHWLSAVARGLATSYGPINSGDDMIMSRFPALTSRQACSLQELCLAWHNLPSQSGDPSDCKLDAYQAHEKFVSLRIARSDRERDKQESRRRERDFDRIESMRQVFHQHFARGSAYKDVDNDPFGDDEELGSADIDDDFYE